MYHFGLLLLEGTKALPPAHNATLGFDQVSADLMETLLLLSGPEHMERLRTGGLISKCKTKCMIPTEEFLFSESRGLDDVFTYKYSPATAKKEATKCDKLDVVCHIMTAILIY